MGQLIYKTGNMLDAPLTTSSALVHSCNAAGEWGGGATSVAHQMRERFPDAYRAYWLACKSNDWVHLRGQPLVHPPGLLRLGIDPYVVSLLVSEGYGRNRSPISWVTVHTRDALHTLLHSRSWIDQMPTDWHSPRLNAGRFRVPWKLTEDILKPIVEATPGITWTVWSLT